MRRVIAAIVLAGCAGWDAEPRARTLASQALHCDAVELEARGESRWRATGCGQWIDVACTSGQNEPVCTRVRMRSAESDPSTVPGPEPEADTESASASESESASASESESESASASASASEPESAPDPEAERALRAAIDARRDDVLACAARDRVVVRVRTDANGAASVSLGGDLAGTPEDGCVRAALGELAGAPSIEVIHLVRR